MKPQNVLFEGERGNVKSEEILKSSKDFETVKQVAHRPKRGSSAQFGGRNHDSTNIRLGDVFIDCSCGLGAV
jgi:hypothetical protein